MTMMPAETRSTETVDAAPVLRPRWSVDPRVNAFTTLRLGGVSEGAHGGAAGQAGGWNLGTACGDDPDRVARNRERLARLLPAAPHWLRQVHGTRVWHASAAADEAAASDEPPMADAAVTAECGVVLVVQTADCLPVFLADDAGTCVGIAHAGWRGLADGVIEATLASMREIAPRAGPWQAWLGPAIGPRCFEVGDDVREAFVSREAAARVCFRPTGSPGKWWADLYALARRRLASEGVTTIGGGEACTVSDPHRFYSYRRDRQTGRMASLIWIDAHVDSADRGSLR